MRLLVTGGRDFADRQKLFDALDMVHDFTPVSLLIAGGARGADTLAIEWAKERGINYHIEKAQWGRFGKSAGIIRNKQMLEMKPNLVVAFAGGNGTRDMVNRSKKDNIEVHIVG